MIVAKPDCRLEVSTAQTPDRMPIREMAQQKAVAREGVIRPLAFASLLNLENDPKARTGVTDITAQHRQIGHYRYLKCITAKADNG